MDGAHIDRAQLIALMCTEARRLVAGDSHLRRVALHVGDVRVEMERSGTASAEETAIEQDAVPSVATDQVRDSDYVTSPVVGTFYHAPEPGKSPFVEVGDVVDDDTVIGIVEAMKLMNKVTANRRGVVAAVLVPDATPVEYGQPLLEITPDERAA